MTLSIIHQRQLKVVLHHTDWHAPRHSKGKFKAAWYRLDDDVVLFDAVFFQLRDCTRDERINNGFVPCSVHDGDAYGGAIELFWLGRAFDG